MKFCEISLLTFLRIKILRNFLELFKLKQFSDFINFYILIDFNLLHFIFNKSHITHYIYILLHESALYTEKYVNKWILAG